MQAAFRSISRRSEERGTKAILDLRCDDDVI